MSLMESIVYNLKPFSFVISRSQALDLTTPILQDTGTLLMKQPSLHQPINMMAFIDVFTGTTWAMVLLYVAW